MTYEDVFKVLYDGYLTYQGRGYQFKTLSTFAKPGKVKISVRWAGNLDFSSEYVGTFEESLDSLKKAVSLNPDFKLITK